MRVVRSEETDVDHFLRVMKSAQDPEEGVQVRERRSEEFNPVHQRVMRSQAGDNWGHHVRVIKSDNDLLEME